MNWVNLLYIKMLSNAKTLLVSRILIFISRVRITLSLTPERTSSSQLHSFWWHVWSSPAECNTQLYILGSICHQCIYVFNIFHTDLSKTDEIMLIIWCSGGSLCHAWHWLKIEGGRLFQWQFESVTHFHCGFKVTEKNEKSLFVLCVGFITVLPSRLEVWLADLLYFLSCIHKIGLTNWNEVTLEFPDQSSNKSTTNFSHLEQDSHWLNYFIWVSVFF